MNGREHLFWGVMVYSIILFCFSAFFGYRTVGAVPVISLFALIVVSILFNSLANSITQKSKEKEKENKKNKVKESSMTRAERKLMLMSHMLSFVFLGLLIIVCVYVMIPASDHPIFIILGYVGAVFGAGLPDMDKVVADISKHRNPFSHSSLTVLALACYATIVLPDVWVSTMLVVIGVLAGNSTHLLCDNIEEEGAVKDFLFAFKHWKECPGDIRHIKEEKERAWLYLNAVLGIVLIVFMFARFDYIDFPWSESLVVYDPATWEYAMTVQALVLCLITLVFYAVILVAFLAWRRDDKKAGNKDAKKMG